MDVLSTHEHDDIIVPAWQVELGKIELQNIATGNSELMTWVDTMDLLKFNETK